MVVACGAGYGEVRACGICGVRAVRLAGGVRVVRAGGSRGGICGGWHAGGSRGGICGVRAVRLAGGVRVVRAAAFAAGVRSGSGELFAAGAVYSIPLIVSRDSLDGEESEPSRVVSFTCCFFFVDLIMILTRHICVLSNYCLNIYAYSQTTNGQ
jgi:hypothetical protein